MDRSQEFFATVESLRSRALPHLPTEKRRLLSPAEQAAAGNAGPQGLKRRSEFATMAQLIAKDIQATYGKLQKLAKLAKRKTLFDDRPVEISVSAKKTKNEVESDIPIDCKDVKDFYFTPTTFDPPWITKMELMHIIKQDIAKLNKQIALLQNHVKDQNARAANSHQHSRQASEHSAHVVVLLQSRLASATSAFKEVLELRTENMKATKDRREQFMFSTQQASAFTSDSPLFNMERKASSSEPPKDVLSLDLTSPFHQHQQQQLQQQTQLQDSGNQYIESRATAIESIESTLQELGGIFQQLAQMVSEQREMVQRIDANTEDIEANVTGAQNELLKYYNYVSSNRWLLVKVFAVVISSAVTLSVIS
ncbi:cis-Golgi t-SNARE syntaxin [Actinomortierella ambigua]|uniref:Cis-Golgi t-SNARE syntaxin n=1 Tax=Actinomortierella ambigua TaxID=1343610 RepID=A0A9P6TY43_9FUNG|nr:cis-Golgi t-SNARE syntaxin [Actinomortierella ambigua]